MSKSYRNSEYDRFEHKKRTAQRRNKQERRWDNAFDSVRTTPRLDWKQNYVPREDDQAA